MIMTQMKMINLVHHTINIKREYMMFTLGKKHIIIT